MAAGDPILINLPNATFLMASETGVIIQSEERDVSSKVKEVFDASKQTTVGEIFYDFVADYNFSAIVNGTSGLAAAAPGVALVLSNNFGIGTASNGVASGGLYTRTVKISHQQEDLRMVSGTAKQRAGVA